MNLDQPGEDVSIKAGSLDDTRDLQPNAHIWLRSGQAWVTSDREKFACFDTEPDDTILLKGSAGVSDCID